MSPDTHADDHDPPEEYRVCVEDRMKRRVHDGHDAVEVLHDTLQAAFDTAEDSDRVTLNFMASHGPGEKPGAPRYHVRLKTENEGLGPPTIPLPVRNLVDRGRAKLTDVVECSDDHLVVSLRPVTRRVEPVTLEKRDIKRLAERAGVLEQ